MQGRKYEVNGSDVKQKLSYVKVPVLFTYTSNPMAIASFVGKVGPQVSFLTTAKLTDGNGNTLIGNLKNQHEKVTFGGVALAGLQLRVSRYTSVSAGLRVDYDLLNAEDEDYSLYPVGRDKTHNMTAGLEIGLKFNLK